MQVVINIPEDYFEIIKHDVSQGNDYSLDEVMDSPTILEKDGD